MIHLLKDAAHQETLDRDGVVRIPFLEESDAMELLGYYYTKHPNGELPILYDGIHMTTWAEDKDYKYDVKAKIEQIFARAYDRFFQNFRPLNHVFIVKQPGEETTFNIHQDWSIVDEDQYPSYNIWMPLFDVDENSGAMWIVKGSHRLPVKIRGAGSLFPNYQSIIDDLKPYTTYFPLKAGEAIVFYHKTIHGSPANLSDRPRIVAVSSIVPEEAPLNIHFRKGESDKIGVYQPDNDSFVYDYNRIREESEVIPPKGTLLREVPLSEYKPLDLPQILEVLEKA